MYQYKHELTTEQFQVGAILAPELADSIHSLEARFVSLDETADSLDEEDPDQLHRLDRVTNELNSVGHDLRLARLAMLNRLSGVAGCDLNSLRHRYPDAHSQLLEALRRLQSTKSNLETNARTIQQVEAGITEQTRAAAAVETLGARAAKLLASGGSAAIDQWVSEAPARLETATAAVSTAYDDLVAAAEALKGAQSKVKAALDSYQAATSACTKLVAKVKDAQGRPAALSLGAFRISVGQVERVLDQYAKSQGSMRSPEQFEAWATQILQNMLDMHLTKAPQSSDEAA